VPDQRADSDPAVQEQWVNSDPAVPRAVAAAAGRTRQYWSSGLTQTQQSRYWSSGLTRTRPVSAGPAG
jgi:hypothetical protein